MMMIIIIMIMKMIILIIPSLINPHTYSRAVQLAATLGPRYLEYERWNTKSKMTTIMND